MESVRRLGGGLGLGLLSAAFRVGWAQVRIIGSDAFRADSGGFVGGVGGGLRPG
jgi:hypothetical protein